MSQFTVNCKNARLHNFIPKHGKAEDAPRACELQIRDAVILPSAAAAVLLAEQGGNEVEDAFFSGENRIQRFWGLDSVVSKAEFATRHQAKIDSLDKMRITLVNKIRLRFEGGPQRLIWADFSLHIEDPSADEVDHFHEQINRDIALVLTQDGDLIDEMIAKEKGMAVSTTIPPNGELELNERDKDQLSQAANGLSKTAEIPLKKAGGGKGKKPPAKKAAAKRAPKKRKAA